MLSITVAIPTHNRPQLLREALQSVISQTYPCHEIIIVDDGSDPPVDAAGFSEIVPGAQFNLVRHEKPKGIAAAKNAGVRAASGEIIMHLDDDDLLLGNALETIANVYSENPELDCVYMNVEPFGKFADGSAKNQRRAVSTVVEHAARFEQDGVVFFNDNLFETLLRTTPVAFQRPAARRAAWEQVGELTPHLFFSEPEWSMRAALCCRVALITQPLSKWRVDGQNYVSRPEMSPRHFETYIAARKALLERLSTDPVRYRMQMRQVRKSLAKGYFDKAYQSCRHGDRVAAWRAWTSSVHVAPSWKHLRLALRILLPLGIRENK